MKGLTNVMNKQEGSSLPVGTIIKCSQSPGEDWAECNGELIDAASCDADLPLLPTNRELLYQGRLTSIYHWGGNNGVFAARSENNYDAYIYTESGGLITISNASSAAYIVAVVCGFVYAAKNGTIYQINKSTGKETSRITYSGSCSFLCEISKSYLLFLGKRDSENFQYMVYKVNETTGSLTKVLDKTTYSLTIPNAERWTTYKDSLYYWDSTKLYEYRFIKIDNLIAFKQFSGSNRFEGIVSDKLLGSNSQVFDLINRNFYTRAEYPSTTNRIMYSSEKIVNGIMGGYLYDTNTPIWYQHEYDNVVKATIPFKDIYHTYDCGNNVILATDENGLYKLTQFTKKLLPYKPGHWIKIR